MLIFRIMTIQQAKSYGKSQLLSSPTPALDSEVFLQHIMNLDKTHLLLNRDAELTAEQENAFRNAIEKRKTGFPVAYIVGHKEFFGYDFYVTPDVLIPKPDTERLVELGIAALEDKFRAGFDFSDSPSRHTERIPTVCDMCAGSGCVGISVAKSFAERAHSDFSFQFSLTFADISEKALFVAQKNAERLLSQADDAERAAECQKSCISVHFVQSNLFETIPQTFDLILTNPPYVPHFESLELLKDGRSEPILALDGDVTESGAFSGTNDGLALIHRLVPQCYDHLAPNGVLIMETGEYNAQGTAELFKSAGFRAVKIEYDMNEMPRDVIGVR